MNITRLFLLTSVLLRCMLAGNTAAGATQISLTGPPGSGQFGQNVQTLPNGNLVVVDPYFTNAGLGSVGAVYLYDGVTLGLISTLTGNSANDQVGSGGITILPNTNFVVLSPGWNGAAGAVTWCSAVTGRSGPISAANSLVGSTANDQVGKSLTILSNGNYVVCSPYWGNYAGAVTWCSGVQGQAGVVSSANSLVGSAYNDRIGLDGVFALPNGHYVVASSYWGNFAGAATWCNGTTGRSGEVSMVNSLVGYSGDDVAARGITVLPNGNYVVCSPFVAGAGGAAGSAGAVTWCNGSTGNIGYIGSYNSLVGGTTADYVGSGGIVVLLNGNYVVVSPNWNSSSYVTEVGAVTWCSGTSGRSGVVSSANSLVGSSTTDQVGFSGVTVLSNGNYVVASKYWNWAYGAATWCSGTSGRSGAVTSANSLVGSRTNDVVGSAGVVPLATGNYVILSPLWDNGTVADAGAATWCNGTLGRSGTISAANSLVGSQANDEVGVGGASALSNGNYVVCSPYWNSGTLADAGAVTWCSGTNGRSGAVSSANSLVGSSANDQVGGTPPAALANGNYVVSTPTWGGGFSTCVGAVTWCTGIAATTGTVSGGNSLVGSSANDAVGGYFEYTYNNAPPPYGGLISIPRSGVTALPRGDYLVVSPHWNSGGPINGGAITWCSGVGSLVDTVSSANSLVGNANYDRIGSYLSSYMYVSNGRPRSVAVLLPRVTVLADGSCAITSTTCHNPFGIAAGAVTFGDIGPRLLGPIFTDNSVFGTAANGGTSLTFTYDRRRQRLAVGDPAGNVVTLISYRVPQTITFDPIPDQQYPGTVVDLSATSSSGLPVTFNVLSGPAMLTTDTQLTLTGTGRVTVIAAQAGDLNTMPAPSVTNGFNVTAIVTSNTGTPIWWLMQYGYTGNFEEAALEDLDGDGALNWQEWVAGTDPTIPQSVLCLLSPGGRAPNLTLRWQSVTNRSYYVQRATNLTDHPSFLTLATNIAGQSGTTAYLDIHAPTVGPAFYRVGVQ